MPKIKTFDNISSRGLDRLPRDEYEVSSEINDPDGILVRSSKLHDIELNDNLGAIARAGVGVDNIPTAKCTEKGIVVFNTPGANAGAVTELVTAALLMTSRKLTQGLSYCQSLKDQEGDIAKLAEKSKKQFGGQEIAGKTLGVIGLGAIGGRVANAAMGLGMNILGFDPWLSVHHALMLPRNISRTEYIQELFQKSDYISVHVPLFDNTKNLVGDDNLKSCKDGVRILNFSRDGIVDNEAIIRAIDSGKVSYYATDFTQPELLGHEQILCFPHLGASTAESEENCAIMAANQLRDFFENGNIQNSINYPVASAPRTTDQRLTVFTENIPNMVGQISSLLGEHKINIAELVNKSREEYAYNLIDLDGGCSDAVIENLKKTEGVIAVRLLG